MRLATFVATEKSKPREQVENICGVLIHAKPERRHEVQDALGRIPGVEVHTMTDDGRMVVTVEDAQGNWAGATITSLTDIRGILNVSLVYHHFDSDLDLEGESFS
ncbi:Periplasmic nitrate reductase component NapD [Paramagnetospirillum magnetotacticum MS-1]|uniref:Chaperone NapD n=2 Tax=Paramagnetospirillum magnetotacticum TaxID=188 RepID=A0A0C2V0Q1_PARME|nr:chaperone NapD [Paramagnetospirillum magnetotacticum]KIL98641.1 Periplasmic nitrate reductase component NapD [Paramagnetospirillum magnetotacticum MS-1]BAB59021.1 soluble protein [Paramagnetospirillum magnetotacticum]